MKPLLMLLAYWLKTIVSVFLSIEKIQHFKALSTLKYLLRAGIIKLEHSKEAKRIKDKRQKLKKELRSYVIQDKIIFANHFTRFFFIF